MVPPYEEIIELISRAGDCVSFAPYGEGVSDEWVAKAEARLGLNLPPSYTWWLKNYSGGQIENEEIYSVYGEEFDQVVGGDIVAVAIRHLRSGIEPAERLYICQPGTDEEFYFKPSEADASGEFPVYCLDQINSIDDRYAASFLEFLQKRILFRGRKP